MKQELVSVIMPTYNAGKLGHIVIPNIEVTAFGQLLLEHRALYMDTISERATVTMINGLKEGKETYYSLLSPEHAQIVLYIEAPSLPQGILVFFHRITLRMQNLIHSIVRISEKPVISKISIISSPALITFIDP